MASRAFVRTSDDEACKSTTWSTLPEMQERAIENGTVLIWNLGQSVGHFIRALIYILPVSELVLRFRDRTGVSSRLDGVVDGQLELFVDKSTKGEFLKTPNNIVLQLLAI